MGAERPYVLLSASPDWDLARKGPADQARHREKVKQAIKDNLAEIVSEESIITSDGKSIVKVPIRGLELPRFRYDQDKEKGVGAGGGREVGDKIGEIGGQKGKGQGKGAGNEPGIDYYEAEITVDELVALAFEDLGLPRLKEKAKEQEVLADSPQWRDVRKTGPLSNLDKRRTLLEHLKEKARRGEKPVVGRIREEDMRFKTWTPGIKVENNAVVIAMRDVSASMGEFEKYISRTFYSWMVRFLRERYNSVKIVFITHHTEAQETDEEKFFKLGESGGTRVSSAYELALKIINERFDPGRWNIYPFHFSDGDNWGEADNKRCLELVEKFLEICNLFGYGEIQENPQMALTTLMSVFSKIQDENFVGVTISNKTQVYPALKKFFHKEGVEGLVSRV